MILTAHNPFHQTHLLSNPNYPFNTKSSQDSHVSLSGTLDVCPLERVRVRVCVSFFCPLCNTMTGPSCRLSGTYEPDIKATKTKFRTSPLSGSHNSDNVSQNNTNLIFHLRLNLNSTLEK